MKYDELDAVVLKGILSNKKNALEFASGNNEKIFSPTLWRFVKSTLDYIRVYKEIPTKRVMLERAGKNESLVNYLNDVWNILEPIQVDEREYKHDVDKLKTKYTEELILRLKNNLAELKDGEIDIQKSTSEIHAALNGIRGVSAVKAFNQKTVKESLPEFRENYKAKLNDPNFGVGIKTGIGFFDFLTSGLSRDGGELLLIGSESNGGKSMLLLNIAINMWMGDNKIDQESDFKEGEDIIFFSLEMSHQECMQRLMARMALVPQFGIRDANLKQEELDRLAQATRFISKYNREFTIIDMPRGATMSSIELVYADIVAKTNRKPKVIVIDYLTLMEAENSSPDEQDWLKTGRLSEAAHEMSRVLGVLVLTATQLNRAKPGSTGMSNDRIARSALQAANANFIIMIEKRQNEQEMSDMRLHLTKNRRGPLAQGSLYKQLDCCALHSDPPAGIFDNSLDMSGDFSDEIEGKDLN
jgi:replicative DNA helicase